MPSYKEDILNDLRTKPGYAAKYLTAAADDSDEAFLIALRDVFRLSFSSRDLRVR
jgi:DNA-binding phage protein